MDSPEVGCYLVRFAAKNFESTVFDTDDLATTRGSSLALLRAPGIFSEWLARTLGESASVEIIYAGASEALLRVLPIVRADPERLSEEERQTLAKLDSELKKLQNRKKKLAQRTKEKARFLHQIATRRAAPGLGTALNRAFDDFAVKPPVDEMPLDLFTFGFAKLWSDTGVVKDLAILVSSAGTLENIHQLQSITIRLPERSTAEGIPAEVAVCAYDRVSPAEPIPPGARRDPISPAARRRRSVGRTQKDAFYVEQLEHVATIARDEKNLALATKLAARATAITASKRGFATDFSEMTLPDDRRLPRGLAGKMALIHLDGNGFGGRRLAFSGSTGALSSFSRHLELLKGDLLADLLAWMEKRPDMLAAAVETKGGEKPERYRFETLMWGGDEMLWVLPAWAAWDAMAVIQRSIAAWTDPKGKPLTMSAGLLVSNHKTPIRALVRLVESLCNAAKHKSDGASANINLVQVAVADVIDEPDPDIGMIRERLFGAVEGGNAGTIGLAHRSAILADREIPEAAFSLVGSDWVEITNGFRRAKNHLGRSQLFLQYNKALKAGLHRAPAPNMSDQEKAERVTAVETFLDQACERLSDLGASGGASPDEMSVVTSILKDRTLSNSQAPETLPLVPFHHLLEFWDVVEPESPDTTGSEAIS